MTQNWASSTKFTQAIHNGTAYEIFCHEKCAVSPAAAYIAHYCEKYHGHYYAERQTCQEEVVVNCLCKPEELTMVVNANIILALLSLVLIVLKFGHYGVFKYGKYRETKRNQRELMELSQLGLQESFASTIDLSNLAR